MAVICHREESGQPPSPFKLTKSEMMWNGDGGGVCLCAPTDIHEQGREGLLKQKKTLGKIHMNLFPILKR